MKRLVHGVKRSCINCSICGGTRFIFNSKHSFCNSCNLPRRVTEMKKSPKAIHDLSNRFFKAYSFFKSSYPLQSTPCNLFWSLKVGMDPGPYLLTVLEAFLAFTPSLGAFRQITWMNNRIFAVIPKVGFSVYNVAGLLTPICTYPGKLIGVRIFPDNQTISDLYFSPPAPGYIYIKFTGSSELKLISSMSDLHIHCTDILNDSNDYAIPVNPQMT
jgi:hypothetical protein